MDLSALRAELSAQKSNALAAMHASKLVGDRADAQNYYLGNMERDMPAEDGSSRVVSTDVRDTIEGLMPALMEIFAGGDEVVRFEPVGPEDENAAQQETDYVNHVFMQQNDGFITLYGMIKDALLSKTGIVKVFWEETEQTERESYFDQTDEDFALLAAQVMAEDSGLEIVEHSEKVEEHTDPLTGQVVKTVSHDVTIERVKKVEQARVMGVPPEEFGIERGARSIKTCNYCFHEIATKTEADLIAEGFDAAQVKALGDYTGQRDIETVARDTVYEHSTTGSGGTTKATRLVRITEHYIKIDYEGDGKPCLYRITTGGDQGEVLRRDGKEEIYRCDVIPFAALTPIPQPHRFIGLSVADLVMDIQRIKTALMRSMLNNQYLHNNPRVEVAETHAGDYTLDDLLVSRRPGGVVRTKQPGGVNWQVVPDISGSIYPALEYMDATREWRTGVTRQGQGIDANALQNQSATAVNQAFTAAQARMKLIARIFAETGIKDMFALLHQVIRKHGGKGQTVRLRNTWVTVDPRQWKTRNDMTINVGLGSGSRSERVAHIMALIGLQEKALQGGLVQLVSPDKLYNSAQELAKLMDYKNAERFFNDPQAVNPDGTPKHPPQPPQPDPKVLEAQGKLQIEQAKLQSEQQSQVARFDLERQIEAAKLQNDKEIAQYQAQLNQQKIEAELALRREQMAAEFALKREQFAAELALKREQMAVNAMQDAKLDSVQFGGDVG